MRLSYLFCMQKTMKMTLLPIALLSIMATLCGCSQKFRIESTPSGASIYEGSRKLGETPMSYSATWRPGKEIPLRIQLPGYRPITIDAGKNLGYLSLTSDFIHFRYGFLSGRKTKSTMHTLLIREHGKVGTWRPNDAKQQR